MRRWIWITAFTIILFFGVVLSIGVYFGREGEKRIVQPFAGQPDLFFYTDDMVDVYTRNLGFPGFFSKGGEVSRNADGSELRFISQKYGKALFLRCGALPELIDIPGYPLCFDEHRQPRAWVSDNHVHTNDGIDVAINGGEVRFDQAGEYFIVSTPGGFVNLHEIKKPLNPVYALKDSYDGRTFRSKSRLLISIYSSLSDASKVYEIIKNNGVYVASLQQIVPLPRTPESGYPKALSIIVQDKSPWSEEFLVESIYDLPYRPKWHEYSVARGYHDDFGSLREAYPAYSQCKVVQQPGD